MQSEILKTPIDDMVEYIKTKKQCTINDISLNLKVPVSVVEKWLVVLEEYNILKLKYKGFKSYVELFEKKKKEQEIKGITNALLDIDNLKTKFISKAKSKNLPMDKLGILWPKFVQLHEIELKEVFYNEGKKLNYKLPWIDTAWAKYKIELLNFEK